MSEVTIKFNFDTSGVGNVDDMIGKLRELDDVGKQSGGNSGGVGNLGQAWSSFTSGVKEFTGAAGKVIDVVSDLNKAGTEALRAQAAFEGLAGGKADEYLNRMMQATHGLIDDTGLMVAATHALSSGALQSGDDLERMTKIGATLGITFAGSAENGVNKIEKALVAVGNYRGLRELGFDIDDLKKKFGEYQATMSKSDAWRMAVLDEGIATANKFPNALDGAGTAMDRFGVKLNDFKDNIGKGVSNALNDILKSIEDIDTFMTKYNEKRAAGPGADGTGTNAAIAGPNVNANYIQEWAKNQPSQAGYGFASLGMTPEEYYRGLAGGSYGDTGQTGLSQMGRIPYWMMSGTPGFDFSKYVSTGPAMSSASTYDTTPRTDEGDYLVRHPEMRRMYSNGQFDPMRDPGLGQAGRWQSGRADDTAAMQGLNNILHLTHDSFIDVKLAAQGLIKPFQDASDAAAKDAERRSKIQSVDDAFGVKKDGFYSEMQGGMGDAFQARRDQVQADLERRYGKNSDKTKQGLNQFDQQAKIEMDRYGLATKTTTPELIYFKNAQDGLNERLRTGKITLTEFTTQMLAMSAAAKDGKVDINSLIDLNYQPQITKAGRKAGNLKWEAQDEKANAAQEGPDGKTKNSVLQAIKKDADDSQKAIDGIATAITTLPTTLTAHVPEAVKAFDPLAAQIGGILLDMQTMAGMAFHVDIVTTSYKNTGPGGGKSKSKAGQVGYFNP